MKTLLNILLPALLIPLIYAEYKFSKKGYKIFAELDSGYRKEEEIKKSKIKKTLSFSLFSLSLVLIYLSLINYSEKKENIPLISNIGRDIVFVFDVSNSMLAEYEGGISRLDRALKCAESIASNCGSCRTGLAAFKGKGIVLLPVTKGTVMLKKYLPFITPAIINSKGTEIYSGLETAVNMLNFKEKTEKIVILFSDGEEKKHNYDKISALKNDLVKFAFILSAKEGEGKPVMLKESGYITDKKGNIILSDPDMENMKKIAYLLDGTCSYIPDIDSSFIKEISLRDMAETRQGDMFLLAGIILLILREIIRAIKW